MCCCGNISAGNKKKKNNYPIYGVEFKMLPHHFLKMVLCQNHSVQLACFLNFVLTKSTTIVYWDQQGMQWIRLHFMHDYMVSCNYKYWIPTDDYRSNIQFFLQWNGSSNFNQKGGSPTWLTVTLFWQNHQCIIGCELWLKSMRSDRKSVV